MEDLIVETVALVLHGYVQVMLMPITNNHTLFAICGTLLPLQCLAQFFGPLAVGAPHVHHV